MLSSATMNSPSEASTSVHARRGWTCSPVLPVRVSVTTTPPFAPDAWPRGPGPPAADSRISAGTTCHGGRARPLVKLGGGERPVSRGGGLCMYDHGARNGRAGMEGWSGERGSADAGPGGRRRGVRRARRALPARAAGALLPVPRLGAGRRGRGAGDAAGGLAGPGRFRGACLGPDLAVPGGDQPLPARAAIG